jgi:hypothetical protein
MKFVCSGRCAAAVLLLVGLWSDGAHAQGATGPIMMRSEGSTELQWWIVDPTSGVAAFYGGDIVAICKEEPDAHDLVDLQELKAPAGIASNLLAQGKDIGASLWERAPTFSVPQLCRDILSQDTPLATGTAALTFTGRFPKIWNDPEVLSPYGMAAQGDMLTPDGESIGVNAHYRCVKNRERTRCTQGVTVKQP